MVLGQGGRPHEEAWPGHTVGWDGLILGLLGGHRPDCTPPPSLASTPRAREAPVVVDTQDTQPQAGRRNQPPHPQVAGKASGHCPALIS